MGLWSFFKTLFLVHAILACVFIVSGLLVNFLMLLTYILVWPWNKALYRKMVTNLGYSHWCQLVALAQWWSGSNCRLILPEPDDLRFVGNEHTVVILNHKYDLDWLMTWILAERFRLLGGAKVYSKSVLRFVPLIGWAWVFVEGIFIRRDWDQDKSIITEGLKVLMNYPDDCPVTLLLFPEGTRFTEKKHATSNAFAQKNGLPELKHHLLPRTKGFVHTMQVLKNNKTNKFKSVLDLTVGMLPKGANPTLMSIINGKPVNGEMFGRRILLEDIPTDTEEECTAWLHQLFREKDEIYDSFLKEGHFTQGYKCDIPKRPHDIVISLMWCGLVGIPLVTFLVNVFIAGSVFTRVVFVAVMVILSVLTRLMISITETEKGSAYGNKTKETANGVNNNSKKLH